MTRKKEKNERFRYARVLLKLTQPSLIYKSEILISMREIRVEQDKCRTR